MKSKKLGTLQDGEAFRIVKKFSATLYKVQTKQGRKVIYTAIKSGYTFSALKSKIVFV